MELLLLKKILLEKFKVKGFELKGITFDSRRVEKNDIFLALKGKQVDGHEFIDDALNNGASIVFSEKESKEYYNGCLYKLVRSM